MLEPWFIVGLGGALGAALRGWLTQGQVLNRLPWRTYWVNLGGTAGLILCLHLPTIPPWLVAGLTVGFCGALTTFSTLIVEVVTRWRAGYPRLAAAYLALTLVAGLAIAALTDKLAAWLF